jgi:hypothetical protein
MPHAVEVPLLIFAIYFALILFTVARGFYRLAGRTMKSKTGADGQLYFFSKRKYGRYGRNYAISAGVPVQNGFVFSICQRTFWHRFLTPLGLAQDLKTGDATLDDAFYFMADDDERLKALLGSPGFIAALREAFGVNQARDIECTRDRLWFNTRPVNFGVGSLLGSQRLTAAVAADPAQLQDIKSELEQKLRAGLAAGLDISEETYASQAARLAQAVEKLEAPDYQRSSAAFPLSRAAFLYRIIHAVFLLLALVLAATLMFRNEDIINTKDFLIEAAGISPVVILLWLSLLMVIFGRTSWFPQVCGSFVLSGLVGLVLLTGFVVREADIDLDHASPDIKTLSLQSKKCSLYCTTGGKHANTMTYPLNNLQCYAAEASATIADHRAQDYRCRHSAKINYDLFFPWPTERAPGETEPYKLTAKAQSYERAYVGQSYAFPIHKGFLGLAWMRKSEIRAE